MNIRRDMTKFSDELKIFIEISWYFGLQDLS
jgi:hypothetical protein